MENSRQKAILFSIFILFAACSHSSEPNSERPLVEKDYRLVEDRKAFEDLRQDVPEEKKIENDELAYIERLFSDPLQEPSRIREKFNKLLSKKREKLSKDLQKKRENFVRIERKDRESFNRDQELQRKDFKNRKADRDETRQFFDSLDQKRKDFNASQKEKRDSFEEGMRDDRKNFDDYVRDKQSEFNLRLKDFTQKRSEIIKSKAPAKTGP